MVDEIVKKLNVYYVLDTSDWGDVNILKTVYLNNAMSVFNLGSDDEESVRKLEKLVIRDYEDVSKSIQEEIEEMDFEYDSTEELEEFIKEYVDENIPNIDLDFSDTIKTNDNDETLINKNKNVFSNSLIWELQDALGDLYGKKVGKYTDIDGISLRISDHSQNPNNIKSDISLSVVISDNDKTKERFRDRYSAYNKRHKEIHFNSSQDINLIIKEIGYEMEDLGELKKESLDEMINSVVKQYGLEQINEDEFNTSPEFGNGDPLDNLSVDETLQSDVLNLISRALQIDPYTHLKSTIKNLPSIANENNYEEIISSIESVV